MFTFGRDPWLSFNLASVIWISLREEFQILESLELFQTGVRDLGTAKTEGPQVLEFPQLLQSGGCDLDIIPADDLNPPLAVAFGKTRRTGQAS
jgi:hypothetical protein